MSGQRQSLRDALAIGGLTGAFAAAHLIVFEDGSQAVHRIGAN
jgi:hypothetical protein